MVTAVGVRLVSALFVVLSFGEFWRFRRGWLGLVRCVTVSHGGLGFGMAWRVPVSRGKFRRSSRGQVMFRVGMFRRSSRGLAR